MQSVSYLQIKNGFDLQKKLHFLILESHGIVYMYLSASSLQIKKGIDLQKKLRFLILESHEIKLKLFYLFSVFTFCREVFCIQIRLCMQYPVSQNKKTIADSDKEHVFYLKFARSSAAFVTFNHFLFMI